MTNTNRILYIRPQIKTFWNIKLIFLTFESYTEQFFYNLRFFSRPSTFVYTTTAENRSQMKYSSTPPLNMSGRGGLMSLTVHTCIQAS